MTMPLRALKARLSTCAATAAIVAAGFTGMVVVPGRTLAQELAAKQKNPPSVTADAPTRREAMIVALGSAKPHPSLGAEAKVFDQLVGAWDCDFSFHADNGSIRHKRGQVLFGWILDGRAIQDIWITYPEKGEQERRIGTSLRFFDTALQQWRVVFLGPQSNYIVVVQGGRQGDRIVLTGVDTDGAQIRWSFNDIGRDSFVWRGEKSRDGGTTWKLEEEHRMRRRD